MPITHSKVSGVADGGDTTLVRPSDWNAKHVGPFALDAAQDNGTLNGTYGDDFTGASLNARWTRRNATSGMETYQSGGGSYLRAILTNANAAMQWYQAWPGGDGEIQAKLTILSLSNPADMFGISLLDASGNGDGIFVYNDGSMYHGVFVSYVYSSNSGGSLWRAEAARAGNSIWMSVAKVGTTYTVRISMDGDNWMIPHSRTVTQTITEMNVGRYFGAINDSGFAIDWFDKL